MKKEGATVSGADVLAFFKGKVPDWQIPDEVVFVDALPLSGTGKVLKNKLRESYKDLLTVDRSESA